MYRKGSRLYLNIGVKMRKLLLILILTSFAFGGQLKPPKGMKPIMGHPLGNKGGLVGCWLTNEGSGNTVQDLSGNGNTGTFVGDVSWVAGKSGHALRLLGDTDYVNCGNKTSLNPISAITIVVRCKVDVALSPDWIIGKYSTADSKRQYQLLRYAGTPDVFGFNLGAADGASFKSANGATIPLANTWYDVVGTWAGIGQPLRLFLNGVEESYTSQDTKNDLILAASTNSLLLGGRIDQLTSTWTGDIEFVYIYNRGLSPSEISLLYRKPFCMFQPENTMIYAGAAAAPPAATGQVIMISAIPLIIPLIVIGATALAFRRAA